MNSRFKKNIFELEIYFISIATITITAIISTLTNQFLYADGSYFFYSILIQQDFNVFDDARMFSQYITQSPLVFSITQLGIENKTLLMLIYGGTLYGVPLICTLLSIYFLENKKLIPIVLVSFLFSSIYAYTFIISEAHVMASIFWLSLVLVSRKNQDLCDNILIVFVLALSTHLYESYLLLSLIIGLLVVLKIKRNHHFKIKLYWLFCLTVVIYGFFVSLISYLHPRDSANAGQFTTSLLEIFTKTNNIWIMFFIFITSILLTNEKFSKFILLLMLVMVTFVMFVSPKGLEVAWSYSGRILLTIVPFCLGVVFFLVNEFYNKPPFFDNRLSVKIENSLNIISIFFLSVQVVICVQWYGYTQIFKASLYNNKAKGIIDYRETLLGKEYYKNQMISEFGWVWTYPTMSYAISNNPVRTIIENKHSHCCNVPESYFLISKIKPKETISFKSEKVSFLGWGEIEQTHRWSIGKRSLIKFYINDSSSLRGVLRLNITSLEEQEVNLYINNKYIDTKNINIVNNTINFLFEPEILYQNDKINTIEFKLPNAHNPNNSDTRILAIALFSFTIE